MLTLVKRIAVCLSFLFATCICLPTNKEIDLVADYIDTLHTITSHRTIYSLFDVDQWVKDSVLKRRRAAMLNKWYKLKREGKPMLGENVNHTQAQNLIVNGYKILTDKKLREAYNWLVNEAPPGFIDEYRKKAAERKKVQFNMPSTFAMILLGTTMWIVFDILCTFLPDSQTQKEIKISKREKKNKKDKRKKESRESKEDKESVQEKKTFRDTITYRVFSRAIETVYRGAAKNK